MPGRCRTPSTTRWLVRFGYDGRRFSGWARQPAGRTIEGAIRDGLQELGIARTPEEAHLEVASRTDRAVSARANALTVAAELSASSLLRRLNAIAPSLFFTAAARVPPEFRVRRASRRTYRYYDARPATDPEPHRAAAALFRGPVDVRSFGREIPRSSPQWREVEVVTADPIAGGWLIEARAPSFVWGMVRKIVGALREVGEGRLTLARLEGAIAGQHRLTLPMAEPEGLVLWNVEYPVAWEAWWPGPNRHQRAHTTAASAEVWRRHHLLAALEDGEVTGKGKQG